MLGNTIGEVFAEPGYTDLDTVKKIIREMDKLALASEKYTEIVQKAMQKYGVDYEIRYYDAKKSDEFYYI